MYQEYCAPRVPCCHGMMEQTCCPQMCDPPVRRCRPLDITPTPPSIPKCPVKRPKKNKKCRPCCCTNSGSDGAGGQSSGSGIGKGQQEQRTLCKCLYDEVDKGYSNANAKQLKNSHNMDQWENQKRMEVICEEDEEEQRKEKDRASMCKCKSPWDDNKNSNKRNLSNEQSNKSPQNTSHSNPSMQASCAEFLSLIHDNVMETVQKCVSSVMKDFFGNTMEKIECLCSQTMRNECLLSKMYLDVMDKIAQHTESGQRQFKTMCQFLADLSMQTEQRHKRPQQYQCQQQQKHQLQPQPNGKNGFDFDRCCTCATNQLQQQIKQKQQMQQTSNSSNISQFGKPPQRNGGCRCSTNRAQEDSQWPDSQASMGTCGRSASKISYSSQNESDTSFRQSRNSRKRCNDKPTRQSSENIADLECTRNSMEKQTTATNTCCCCP